MIIVEEFYKELVSSSVDTFFGVPDSLLKDFCACASDLSPNNKFIISANEGNAVGMACGWHMATGCAACVYMQNSGEGNAINPLLSLADGDVYSIPMLLLIGWRGEPGVQDEPQHVKQGKVTCSLLETMGIPYEILSDDNWKGQVSSLLARMYDENRPVALIVRKGTFSPWLLKAQDNGFTMSREQALTAVLSCLGSNDLVVSTTGKESREVFEIRESCGLSHATDFLTVGGMGHTASIAWGMALGVPEATVWCLDGDGSLLMHMGSLAVVTQHPLPNLKYIVNVNGAHESVGGQPNVAGDIDIVSALKSFGVATVVEAQDIFDVEMGMKTIRNAGFASLVLRTRQGSREDLGRPTVAPKENKSNMMELIQKIKAGT